jgi:hypothetical protein
MPFLNRNDQDRFRDEAQQVDRGLRGLLSEVFRRRAPYEDAGPRDAAWLRWAKFLSILFVLTLLCGFGFVYANGSFLVGASIGLVLGITYVARCIMRDMDP